MTVNKISCPIMVPGDKTELLKCTIMTPGSCLFPFHLCVKEMKSNTQQLILLRDSFQ